MPRKDSIATPRQQRFGDHVRQARASRRWSQDDLAGAAAIDRTYISQIEQGRRNVTLEVTCKLALALGVDAADLVRGCQDVGGKPESRKL